MYRVIKSLNNNGILALDQQKGQEVILLGNGVGFGKKPGQRLEDIPEARRYELADGRRKTPALNLVNSIEPVYLELTAWIVDLAEERFSGMRRVTSAAFGRPYCSGCQTDQRREPVPIHFFRI